MKFNQLRCFLAVAQHRSIRAAARALPLSQPAVTKCLRELERDLGVPLVVRGVGGAQLTEFGEAFRLRASLLMEEARRAREELTLMRDGDRATLSVAVGSTVALTLLPPAVAAFRQAFPKAQLSLWEEVLPSTLKRLRDGSLDLVVMQSTPDAQETDFDVNPLYTMQSIVGARAQHPLVRSRSLRSLLDAQWLLPTSALEERSPFKDMFGAHGLPMPSRITSCYSLTLALGLIKQMDFLALFAAPLAAGEFARHGLKALPLREKLAPSSVSLITRKGSRHTYVAQAFMEVLERLAKQMR
jgi:DNA-binding transcriptional LysR family regulator